MHTLRISNPIKTFFFSLAVLVLVFGMLAKPVI